MFKAKKNASILLIGIGLLLLLLALFFFFNTPNRHFEKLCDSVFEEELSADGLSLHYTLAFPDAYGISAETTTLSPYDKTQSLADYQALLSLLEELNAIDSKSLNTTNRRTYDILTAYMEREVASYTYLYYDEPLSPTSGMQNQLPILLAEYAFRNEEDVINYLSLLRSVPTYFSSLAVFEKEKSAEGLFMSADACHETILQCNEIISEEALSEGNHFLQTSFVERIQTLVNDNILSSSQANAYIAENNEILKSHILPAYKSLAHILTSLTNSGSNENGLYYYPEGRDYYKILIERQTGSSKSPEEMMSSIKTAFTADYSSFTTLAGHMDFDNNITVFSISEPDKMLHNLEGRIQEDFPFYPNADPENTPSYEIKKVSDSMEDYLSPAFYLTPPIDDVTENVIYINYGHSPDNLDLYTTLAHEGYPGHLYQSVFSTLALEEQNAHPIRHLMHFGGYVEGYATYAELYSYKYTKDFGDDDYCELVCLNRKLHLALYSMLDISIHYYGTTYEEAHNILCSFGIEDEKTTREIYDYIVNSPGNYLQYYVGYLEIMECRELAKVKWKDNYSDLYFHEFILNFGPADFDTIKDAIREYEVPNATTKVSISANADIDASTSLLLSLQYDLFLNDVHQVKGIPPRRLWT